MRRETVFDLFVVIRCIGYALAATMGLFSLGTFALSLIGAPAWGTVASIFVPGIVAGLVVAWTASMARMFLRFSRFTSSQP